MPSIAKRFLPAVVFLCGTIQAQVQTEQEQDLVGEWMLTLENRPADLMGLLFLEQDGDGLAGYVEGGPINLSVEGSDIELRIDSRDAGARQFDRVLTGEITEAADGAITMSGTYISTAINADSTPRPWQASRYTPVDTSMLAPEPVDFSGMWNGGSGVDLRKYSMDIKPHAAAWNLEYDTDLDQPPLRCLSPGVVQLFGYVYPVEIVHAEDRIYIITEAYTQVRQIYMDGREAPVYYPVSRLGYSVGHWEGSTLVINTTKIRSNIRDFKGEPLSDNVTTEERWWLSDDGQYLHSTMVVNDPDNYYRPAIRRVRRERTDDVIMLPYECDPDSFYRQLYEEGKMDEYWSRTDKRL